MRITALLRRRSQRSPSKAPARSARRVQTAPLTFTISIRSLPDPAYSGTCDDKQSNCGDNYVKAIPVTSTWTQITVKFSDMKQAGWGRTAAFGPHEIVNVGLNFAANTATDFDIDEVSFVP